MTTSVGFVGQALPAKIIRVSSTNLFRVAATELGDPLQWTRIASLNGLDDPWIGAAIELRIPGAGQSTTGGVPTG